MAMSHQWFLQWNTPQIVLTDVNTGYGDVNSQWNNQLNTYNAYNTLESATPRDTGYYRTPYYGQQLRQNNEYISDNSRVNDHTRVAGVTLWLTMLGLAQPQAVTSDSDTPPFNTLYKWKQIDFEFLSEEHRFSALSGGEYIPENVLPLGLEIWGSRVWVTLPRWRQGVPATLATVPRAGGDTSPLLRPYPDWNYHRSYSTSNNCSGLTSVFRISVDNCGKLWVLDSGQIDSQDDPKQICPPAIVVFDLNSDTIIARYTIPKKFVLQNSLFSNIIVDTRRRDCSDLHLYITDTWRFGLIVFRERDASFWRFTHHFFYPDPLASNYSLHGINFQWTDGIFGLALTPVNNYKERLLFFHPMSGSREFFVKTSILQNPLLVNSSETEFKIAGESRGSFGQSSASAIDDRGVMFNGLVTRDTVGCWDTRKAYLRMNTGVVAMNTDTLIFPNDIKVDHEKRQSVWVISNRLPMFQKGLLKADDYNYRIMYSDTTEAVRGTVCDPSVSPPHSSLIQRGWLS